MDTDYPVIRFRRTTPDAIVPSYAHEGDAGMDLCATRDVTLRPGESAMVGSGIAIQLPRGFAGFVHARSGLGSKGLVIKHSTGVIDSGYRDEIKLVLFNNNPITSDRVFHVKKGDRVAQLVIQHVACATMAEVKSLEETERGTGGFGSSGIRPRI
jgi:dUTP pyrophosphatase